MHHRLLARPRRPHRMVAVLATAVLSFTVPAFAQSKTDERNLTVPVTLMSTGEGNPVVLRWRPSERVERRIQVATRTVPTTLERPDVNSADPKVLIAGFTRPPIEKLWTIAGRLTADPETKERIVRWRVENGAARLVGFRPTADARNAATKADDAVEPADGAGQAPPRRAVEAKDATDSKTSRPQGSDSNAMKSAIRFEEISNRSIARTNGAMITQRYDESGLVPLDVKIRLPESDRRAEFETRRLAAAMNLAEAKLPTEPIAPGASWTASWVLLESGVPARIDATWTLLETDEAASGTGVATTARLKIEYRRRVLDADTASETQRRVVEADGRGEIRIRLDAPLLLDARLVEQPILPPAAGRSREVTRIRVTPLAATAP